MSNFSEVRASGREDGHSRVAVAVADVDDSSRGDGDILWAKLEDFRIYKLNIQKVLQTFKKLKVKYFDSNDHF